jgi:hypothetical protein
MFTIDKKKKRKLRKRKENCILMINRINRVIYKDELNRKHILLKYYGKEIESINSKLFISKYCF